MLYLFWHVVMCIMVGGGFENVSVLRRRAQQPLVTAFVLCGAREHCLCSIGWARFPKRLPHHHNAHDRAAAAQQSSSRHKPPPPRRIGSDDVVVMNAMVLAAWRYGVCVLYSICVMCVCIINQKMLT